LENVSKLLPLGWIFAHMSFALPVKRLYESENLVAFYHPHPSYPFHVLLVPKHAVRNLMELSTADSAFWVDLLHAVQILVKRFDLETTGYRLIVNGGPNQDIQQLHFHLISETSCPIQS